MDNQYRVALIKNKKLYRVIKDYKILKHAKNRFNKIKSENLVLFPKIFFNHKKIQKKEYEVLLLRRKGENDSGIRKIFNENGNVIKEVSIGDWVIIDKLKQLQEEYFHVYGLDNRLNVAELLKEVFVPRMMAFYQVLMVLNKIVIVDGDDMEVILCKNLVDCQRLYDFLFDTLKSKGIHNFIFLGKASKSTRSAYYDQIQAHTGLTRRELYRTSTRS